MLHILSLGREQTHKDTFSCLSLVSVWVLPFKSSIWVYGASLYRKVITALQICLNSPYMWAERDYLSLIGSAALMHLQGQTRGEYLTTDQVFCSNALTEFRPRGNIWPQISHAAWLHLADINTHIHPHDTSGTGYKCIAYDSMHDSGQPAFFCIGNKWSEGIFTDASRWVGVWTNRLLL